MSEIGIGILVLHVMWLWYLVSSNKCLCSLLQKKDFKVTFRNLRNKNVGNKTFPSLAWCVSYRVNDRNLSYLAKFLLAD